MGDCSLNDQHRGDDPDHCVDCCSEGDDKLRAALERIRVLTFDEYNPKRHAPAWARIQAEAAAALRGSA